MRRGFSLLEVLAATVVLGLLAVAVVPLTARLTSDDGHLYDRIAAGEWLQRIEPATLPRAGLPTPVQEHPGWWLRSESLTPTVPPQEPGRADLRPGHRWTWAQLVDGPSPTARVLAERLLVVVDGAP